MGLIRRHNKAKLKFNHIGSRVAFLARNLGDPSPGWALRDLHKTGTEPCSLMDARIAPESKVGRIPAAVAALIIISNKPCLLSSLIGPGHRFSLPR